MFVSVYRRGTLRRITTTGTPRKVASKVKVGYPGTLLQDFHSRPNRNHLLGAGYHRQQAS
jgi:hypothetical protein